MKKSEKLISDIKKGGFPGTTGISLSQSEIDELEVILEKRKQYIDSYFNGTINIKLHKNIK